jgi:hypothetical protein
MGMVSKYDQGIVYGFAARTAKVTVLG